MRNFSALEIMALSVLPEKARIGRIAYICRKNRISATHRDCRIILEKLGEPHGAKGRLTIALRAEIKRQDLIRHQRRSKYARRNWSYVDTNPGFDVVSTRFYGWNRNHPRYGSADYRERCMSICLNRIAPHVDGLIPNVTWWNGQIFNWSVKDTRLRKNGCLLLIKPHWRSYHPEQKLQYLVFLNGKEAGYTVVPKRIKNIEEALASLESAQVKSARKKGFDVKFDWTNQAFTVKSPRRVKSRSIAWKCHTRSKRR